MQEHRGPQHDQRLWFYCKATCFAFAFERRNTEADRGADVDARIDWKCVPIVSDSRPSSPDCWVIDMHLSEMLLMMHVHVHSGSWLVKQLSGTSNGTP